MRILKRIVIILFAVVTAVFCAVQVRDRFFTDRTPPQLFCDSQELTVSVYDGDDVLLQGVTAVDDQDGDLTSQVFVEAVSALTVNNAAQVSYCVFDSAGNLGRLQRTIHYSDYTLPRFSLTRPLVFQTGSTITLSDLKAADCVDGDLTASIRVSSVLLDIYETGEYTITVQVTNSMGDTAILTLPIRMVDSAPGQYHFLREYLVYYNDVDNFDPADYVRDPSSVTWDDSALDPRTPGVYPVVYTKDDVETTLFVVVE